jgi:hypothetical protein
VWMSSVPLLHKQKAASCEAVWVRIQSWIAGGKASKHI